MIIFQRKNMCVITENKKLLNKTISASCQVLSECHSFMFRVPGGRKEVLKLVAFNMRF